MYEETCDMTAVHAVLWKNASNNNGGIDYHTFSIPRCTKKRLYDKGQIRNAVRNPYARHTANRSSSTHKEKAVTRRQHALESGRSPSKILFVVVCEFLSSYHILVLV